MSLSQDQLRVLRQGLSTLEYPVESPLFVVRYEGADPVIILAVFQKIDGKIMLVEADWNSSMDETTFVKQVLYKNLHECLWQNNGFLMYFSRPPQD